MRKYCSISNADGKTWVMPIVNMSMGMLLYQPSGWKGKALKKFLPTLYPFHIVRKILHITYCDCPIKEDLKKQLESIFEESGLEYSWFGGTPNTHQKITIQIFRGKHIYGYCKVTTSQYIYNIFQREQKFLNWMEEKGVGQTPKCLYCGTGSNGSYIFVQTTVKTPTSLMHHELGTMEMDFIRMFVRCTRHTQTYEESDLYTSVERMKQQLGKFDMTEQSTINTLIQAIEKQYKKSSKYEFAAYHSDFTPWNMFVEKNELFVFDFEYAQYSNIPYLDIFHYIFQTMMFEKRSDAASIMNRLRRMKSTLQRSFDHYEVAIAAYLIDIIGFYAERDKGFLDSQQVIRLQVARLLAKQLISDI